MEWKELFGDAEFEKGVEYVTKHRFKDEHITDDEVSVTISENKDKEEFVKIQYKDGKVDQMYCSCNDMMIEPYNCAHKAAACLLKSLDDKEKKDQNNDPNDNNVKILKQKVQVIEASNGDISLSAEVNDYYCYALQQNGGIPLIKNIIIKNSSSEEVEDYLLHIETDNELIKPYNRRIDIQPQSQEVLNEVNIVAVGDYLASVIETVKCFLSVELIKDEEVLISENIQITVLPYNHYLGTERYTPDLLAAYIIPSHPFITEILKDTGDILKEMKGDNAIIGYQGDRNNVIIMVKAIYLALFKRNIQYIEISPSFEDEGQKVRFPEEIEADRAGNCMDISLLYLACLEAAGLNGVAVFVKGHMLMGVWLDEDASLDVTYTNDCALLSKKVANGELILINAVDISIDKYSFEDAVSHGERYINETEEFEYAIDIRRARYSGIKPLPYRIKEKEGYSLHIEDKDISDLITDESVKVKEINLSDINTERKQMTKLLQWERRLLNLSTANILVNTRREKIVQILSSNIDQIEDLLSDDKAFVIRPVLEEEMSYLTTKHVAGLWHIAYEKEYEVSTKFKKLIDEDINKGILHTYYFDDKSLEKDLVKLYKDDQSSIEETGNSMLYMTIGMLKWRDDKKTKKDYYSPIILVPIEFELRSVSEGLRLKKRDADTIVNMTLIELLNQQFNINIPGIDPPPEDEHGLDVAKIFEIIRQAVMNMEGWDIIQNVTIGNFSFGQFVMWNDIHSHPEFLENNKIVKSLTSGVTEWDTTIPEKVDTDIPYLPVSVDASQLRAVNMAANNVSFILQGPPGTGKSQTITAMIANALMKGKRVLFVAEKSAALDVVSERLQGIGLEDFCLDIYGKKETKRNILNQISRNMELKFLGIHTDYDSRLKELQERKAYLDAYATELHKKLPCGFSVRQLIDEYESIEDTGKNVRFDREFVLSCDLEKLNDYKKLLTDLVIAGKEVGHPKDSVYKFVGVDEYSQSLRRSLEEGSYEYIDQLKKLDLLGKNTAEIYKTAAPKDYSDWIKLTEISKALINSIDIPEFLLSEDDIDQTFFNPIKYLSEKEEYQKQTDAFLDEWDESILNFDFEDLMLRLVAAEKKLIGKVKAKEAILSELFVLSKKDRDVADVDFIKKSVDAYRNKKDSFKELENSIGSEWKEIFEKYPTDNELKEYKQRVKESKEAVGEYSDSVVQIIKNGNYEECVQAARAYLLVVEDYKTKDKEFNELLQMMHYNPTEDWVANKIKRIEDLTSNMNQLKIWIEYRHAEQPCIDAGLDAICEKYREGLEHDEVIPTFFKSLYKEMIWQAMDELPDVNKFSGNTFKEKVNQFYKLDNEFVEVTKEEILYQLRQKTPSALASVEKSINGKEIRKAIKSGGRGTSIRKLMSERFNTIITCCPCMLMTPLTVAKYIPPKNDVFDLVVFDEASQLPTAQAVGVIARGKNAVIVGDPNQMPPTAFFSGKYDDYENSELADLDSILDDCQVIGMPDTHLAWHYRSRHESLIAFSNRNYYENDMLTFPSVNDRERRVSLVTVNGRKKGNINEKEAQRVVEEIVRRYNDEELRKKTIGVVTFNISQCRYIEKLLAEEYKKNPEMGEWAMSKEDTNKRLFVKNLENVQGDERDVILFSTTFGYDENNNFSVNFGPLNKDGGWRRLNVAVTRSKEEMIVFTSMTSSMINEKGHLSDGVAGVRDFLLYAETGALPQEKEEATERVFVQGIKQHICDELSKNGYKYKTDLGYSEFKIDIAVVNPNNESEYILGIMLDGDSYKIAGNTRDREVAQIAVLKGLGWNIHRIWTMDWWDDKEREIKVLMELITKLVEEYDYDKKDHFIPESEEIIAGEPVEKKRNSTKKDKVAIQITEDRFNPEVEHTDSIEERNKLEDDLLLEDIKKQMQKNIQ